MKILVTGVAGFIGYHTVKNILYKNTNCKVIGIDSINSYYSKKLKLDRIKDLKKRFKKNFIFKKINISNKREIIKLFKGNNFHTVINLAAQAGVRYSLKNPDAYFNSNLKGFFNILEGCRIFKIKHLISASTSSVYGANHISRFSTKMPVGHPIQFYAATKRSNEIIGHSYSHIYKLPITFLRFFTVYGPWGRPDMSLFLFVKNILQNKPINVYNFGKHSRDFTYVDDIVSGILKVIKKIPKKNTRWNSKKLDQSTSFAPFKILNLGSGKKISLFKYIKIIERQLEKKAIIKFFKMQKGDIQNSLSDIKETKKYINFKPKTNLEKGIRVFINWFKDYYQKF